MSDRHQIIERRATTPFRESRPRSGNREVTIIEAGWGSSGYYSEDVLREYGPQAWPEGTNMYLNHPTLQEEVERPERDIRDWVGVLETTPRMGGIALISEAKVFEHWQPVIDSIADKVGLSVMAPAVMEHGDAGGRHGPIIKEILHDPLNTVDYVTIAGAGGKVGQLIESARGQAGDPADEEVDIEKVLYESSMTPDRLQVLISKATDLREAALKETSEGSSGRKEISMEREQELQTQLSEAQDKIRQLESDAEESKTKISEAQQERDEAKQGKERAEDALLISGASTIAREVASRIEGLPDRAQTRVVESAIRELPKKEDGKLDDERVRENAKKAARSELEYLAGKELEGELPVREDGVSSPSTTTTTIVNGGGGEGQTKEQLKEAFQKAGLSEAAAERAAEGR